MVKTNSEQNIKNTTVSLITLFCYSQNCSSGEMLENTRVFGLAAQIRNWLFSINTARIHKSIFIDDALISFWSLEVLKIFEKIW